MEETAGRKRADEKTRHAPTQLPEVKEFVRRVAEAPLDEIGGILEGFTWKYEKGCIFHWADALNRIDQWFEVYVAPNKQLKLLLEDEVVKLGEQHGRTAKEDEVNRASCTASEPKGSTQEGSGSAAITSTVLCREHCLSILKASAVIMENCNNRGSYGSVEYVTLLLGSCDVEIVCAALELLSIVFRRTWHQGHSKWSSDVKLNERLVTLAQGWGGQAQGLGLVDCVAMDGDMPRLDTCKLGKHICFRFLPDTGPSTSTSSNKGPVEIRLPWGGYKGMKNEHELLEYLIREFKVPQCVRTRLSLLMRVRMSLFLPLIEGRRSLSKLRLLALICVQHVRPSTHPEQLATMYSSEPELFTELVIIQREMGCVPENLRALALRAAGATVASRGRGSVVLLQQRSLASSVLNGLMRKVTSAMCKGDAEGEISESFAEALLALIAALLSSANGCTVLSEAGAVPSLLPLLEDVSESHILLVTHVVRVLEAFIDVSHNAADAFVELNGSDVLIHRLEVEVNQVVQSNTLVNYNKRLLIKALLRAIGLACFGSGNPPVPQSSEDGPMARLLASLASIFKLVEYFGGGVFSLAASVTAEHIHNDPRGFSALENAGLPTSFLQAVESGIPLTSDAICAVPGALAALCLNERGKEAVCKSSAASFIVPLMKSVATGDLEALHAFHGQTGTLLGSSLDELMRHVPAMREHVVKGLVECLDIVALHAGVGGMRAASAAAIPVTCSDDEGNMFRSVEIMAVLLDSSLAATPAATLFCEKGGLDKTLRLLCLPNSSITSKQAGDDQHFNSKYLASLHYTFSQLIRGLVQRSNAPESASVEIARVLKATIDSSTGTASNISESTCEEHSLSEQNCEGHLHIASGLRSESLALLCSSMIKAWPSFVVSFVSEGVYEKLGHLHSLANARLLELESKEGKTSAGPGSEGQEMLIRIVSATRNLMVSSVKACAASARGNISPSEVDKFAGRLVQIWVTRIRSVAHLKGNKRCLALQHAVDELGVLLFDSRRHTCNIAIFPAFVDSLLQLLLDELVAISKFAATCGDELVEDVEKVVDSMVVLLEHTVSAPLLLSSSSSMLVANRVDSDGKPLSAIGFVENLKVDVGRSVQKAMNVSGAAPSSVRSGLVALLACAADPEGFVEEEEEQGNSPPTRRQNQALPESAVLRIMETGFSRERAEAALRASSRDFQAALGGASDILVNLAVEWLLSHNEEEIAAEEERNRQSSEQAPLNQGANAKEAECRIKAKNLQRQDLDSIWNIDLLPVAATFLGNDGDAFALADLAHSIASRHGGEEMKKVAESLLSMIKEERNIKLVAHACSLLAAHDTQCHGALAGANAVDLVLDILEKMQDQDASRQNSLDASAALLVILTTMLQSKPRGQVDGDSESAKPGAKNCGDDSMNVPATSTEVGGTGVGPSMASLESALAETAGSPMGYLNGMHQLRALHVSIQCIKLASQQGSSHAPMLAQAALELVARLTRVPTLAKQFFMGGGVPLVIHLPSACWFHNFDVIGAAILRHVVEDPVTLKTRFGADIRKALSSSPAQTDGQHRLLMRSFLQTHASQLSREPSIFLAAVEETCTLKRIGGRDYICLKEVQNEPDADHKAADGRPPLQSSARKDDSPMCKRPKEKEKEKKDSEPPPKTPRRKVPSSFVFVVDQLVSVVQHFNATPLSSDQRLDHEQRSKKRKRDKKAQQEKGLAAKSDKDVSSQEQDSTEGGSSDATFEAARAAFCLDVLVSLLPYPGAVSLFLRRESGFIAHLLHDIIFPLSQPGIDADKALLAAQGGRLLGSICLQSAEGRRRVFSDIANKFREDWQGPPIVLALLRSLLQPPDGTQDTRSKLSRKAAAHAMQQTVIEAARAMRQCCLIPALLAILSHMDFSGHKASSQVESILSSLERIVRLSAMNKTDKAAQVEEKKDELNQQGLDSAVDGVVAQISQILGSEHGLGGDNQSMEDRDFDSYTDDSEDEVEDSMGADVHLHGEDSQEDSDLMESELDEDDMEAGASDGEPPPIYRGIPDDSAEMTLGESDDDEDNEMQDDEQEGDDEEEDDFDEDDDFDEEDSEAEGNYTDGEDELYQDRDLEFVTDGDLSAEEEELDREEELITDGDEIPAGDDVGMYYTEDELVDGEDLEDGEPQLIEVRWQMPARVRRTGSYLQDGVGGNEVDRQPPLRAMRRFRDLDTSAIGQAGTGRRWQLRQSRASQRNNFSAASSLVLTHPLLQRQANEPGALAQQSGDSQLQGIAQSMLRAANGPFSSLLNEAVGDSEVQSSRPEGGRAHSAHRSLHGHPYVSVVGTARDSGRYAGSASAAGRLRASLDYTLNPILLEAPADGLQSTWAVVNYGSRLMRSSASTPVGDPVAVQDSLEQHLRDRLMPTSSTEDAGARNASGSAEAADNEGDGNGQQQAPNMARQTTQGISSVAHPPTTTDLEPIERQVPQIEANTEPVVESPGNEPAEGMQGVEGPSEQAVRAGQDEGENAGADGVLDEQTLAAARAAGIDPTVLAELPADLRSEIMASHMAVDYTRSRNHTGGQGIEGVVLDPEFLAALPDDIAEEIRASRSVLGNNSASDIDNATILSSFPPSLRREVLLTAGDNFLASLPSSLLAEAHAVRGQNHPSEQMLGGSGDRADNAPAHVRNEDITVMRNTMQDLIAGTRRRIEQQLGSSQETKRDKKEFRLNDDEEELIDSSGVAALVRLLRVAAPLRRGPLSLVLSNFAWHPRTCKEILRQLCIPLSATETSSNGGDLFRLLGGETGVVYSKAPEGEGAPPLVTGRTLETLRQMASLNKACAKAMLSEKVACNGTRTVLQLVTSLLHRPLYRRSPLQLDSALRLIECLCMVASTIQKKLKRTTEEEQILRETSLAASDPQFSAQVAAILGSLSVPSGTKSKCLSCLEATVSSSPLDASKNFISAFIEEIRMRASEATAILSAVVEQNGQVDEIGNAGSAVLRLVRAGLKVKKIIVNAVSEIETATSVAEKRVKAILEEQSTGVEHDRGEAKDNGRFEEQKGPEERNADLAQLKESSAEELALLQRKEKVLLQASNCVSQIESKLLLDLSSLWGSMDGMSTFIEGQMSSVSQSQSITFVQGGISAEVVGMQEGQPGRVAARLPPDAALVTPVIEAFFLLAGASSPDDSTDRRTSSQPAGGTSGTRAAGRASLAPMLPSGSPSSEAIDLCHVGSTANNRPFSQFARTHRMLLNAILQRNAMLLQGAFAPLLQTPHLLDFGNKRAYFRGAVRALPNRSGGSLRLHIRREHVFDDSYHQLRVRSPNELRGKLNIQFTGEEGVDAGGLTREWYQLLSREMFNVQNGLFEHSAEGSLQPSPGSAVQPDHLSFFRFAGRFVAKAVLDGHLVDVHFTRSFYKHLLGVPITYEDIEAVDPDFYKNLKWMLENSIDGVLDLTFSTEMTYFGKTDVVELKEGGSNVPVTDANKAEYVNLISENRMTGAIRPQIKAFLEAFRELVPSELTAVFNPSELELLISGLPHVDMEDLRANTEYSGYTVGSPVIQWFWDIVREFGKVDKSRLIQFVTGTSKVPIGGFAELQGVSGPQKFQIHRSYKPKNSLPCAHTCFNQLDLVEYDSKDILKDRLLTAIREGSEGFGFA